MDAGLCERRSVRQLIRYALVIVLLMTLNGCALIGTGSRSWHSAYYPADWMPPTDRNFHNFYTDAFLQDMSYAGYQHREKPLPNVRGPVFDLSKPPYNVPGTGNDDVTDLIQEAIDDAEAAGGGVVYLPAGLYRVSPRKGHDYCLKMGRSHVVLRGAGKNATRLLNTCFEMRNNSIVRVEGGLPWSTPAGPVIEITEDLMGPTRSIPLADASVLAVGDLVVLTMTVTRAWINEHKVAAWLGYENKLKPIQYCRRVTSVDTKANRVTIDVPIRYALQTRDHARTYKIRAMTAETGIEDLSIANIENPSASGWCWKDFQISGTAAYSSHNSWLIDMRGVVNGWIRNVGTWNPEQNLTGSHLLSNGIRLDECKNVTVSGCYIGHVQYGGEGGNGYAYRIQANEILVTGCIAESTRHGFVFARMTASGNVLHRCVDIGTGIAPANQDRPPVQTLGSDHHMHFSHSNLIDNCTLDNSIFMAVYRPFGSFTEHALSSAHSIFWNTKCLRSDWDTAVFSEQARYGYVIGTSGAVTAVKTTGWKWGEQIAKPEDIVEGAGRGESLRPQSLYLDQLARRLALKGD